MMQPAKTHHEIKSPQITVRYLSDYMAASEKVRRSIVRKCKYQAIARVVQHDEAKLGISSFFQAGASKIESLLERAQTLRNRLADSDFERDVLDHNADYLDRFALVYPSISIPKAEVLSPGKSPATVVHGVRVKGEIVFRLRRVTKTNKVRVGAAMLRYAKGKDLSAAVADWQTAFLLGLLAVTNVEAAADPEGKLCLVLDAHGGICYSAPTDAVSRFQNMEAACATIAERWPNIKPPDGAIL